jgi:hypothetical protein
MNGIASRRKCGLVRRRGAEAGRRSVPYNASPGKTLEPPLGRFAPKSARERARRGIRKKRNGRSKKR